MRLVCADRDHRARKRQAAWWHSVRRTGRTWQEKDATTVNAPQAKVDLWRTRREEQQQRGWRGQNADGCRYTIQIYMNGDGIILYKWYTSTRTAARDTLASAMHASASTAISLNYP